MEALLLMSWVTGRPGVLAPHPPATRHPDLAASKTPAGPPRGRRGAVGTTGGGHSLRPGSPCQAALALSPPPPPPTLPCALEPGHLGRPCFSPQGRRRCRLQAQSRLSKLLNDARGGHSSSLWYLNYKYGWERLSALF